MKIAKIIPAAFALTILVATAAYSQAKATVPKGVSTINFKGSVHEEKKTLTLNLKAGQTVNLSVTSISGKVVFDAYYFPAGEEFGTPLATETKAWNGILPTATKFTIDLYTPDKTRTKYKFTVQVVK